MISNVYLAVPNSKTPVCRVESAGKKLRKGARSMPERRGVQATEEVKAEWSTAYKVYLRAPGDRFDKKKDRTARIDYVAQEMKLTRKQAKRRIRNYEAWQRNIKKGIAPP
jgi:hypothetical protein